MAADVISSAWGTHVLQFNLPAANVCLTGLSADQRDMLRAAYPAFVADRESNGNKRDITCQAYQLRDRPNISLEDMVLDGQYAPKKVRSTDGIALSGINFEAKINLTSVRQTSSLGVAQEQELAYANVIENFLRIFAAHRAVEQGGVVLHSAGVVFDEQAYIFSGRSNAGKTTLTRKAHAVDAGVLSDDINLLLPAGGTYRAHAVPFTGEFGRTLQHEAGQRSYPVAGIILLEQAEVLSTERVNASAAVARLLTGCPFVNTDPVESAALFDVLAQLVECVPVIRLRNRRDDSIGDIMQAVKNEFDLDE